MIVPTKKLSRARYKKRRFQKERLTKLQFQRCQNCGILKLPHRVCDKCGFYKGKLIKSFLSMIKVKEGKKDKKSKIKT